MLHHHVVPRYIALPPLSISPITIGSFVRKLVVQLQLDSSYFRPHCEHWNERTRAWRNLKCLAGITHDTTWQQPLPKLDELSLVFDLSTCLSREGSLASEQQFPDYAVLSVTTKRVRVHMRKDFAAVSGCKCAEV